MTNLTDFDHNSETNSDTLGLADIFICGLDVSIFSFPLLLTKCEQNNDSNNSVTIQFYPECVSPLLRIMLFILFRDMIFDLCIFTQIVVSVV